MNSNSKAFLNRLLLLGVIGAFILGCLGVITLPTLWVLFNHDPNLSRNVSRVTPRSTSEIFPAPIQSPTDTVTSVEPVPLQNASTATPFLLPEPSPTFEPTETATRVITQTATATSSPTAIPTPEPTAIPLPTNTPLPLPTPTAILPQTQIEHVVIISIDGLRPDALEKANTPTLDALRTKGVYSPKAQTVIPSATLISHASMLGGMIPDKHGIYWNIYNPDMGKVKGPTLFTLAHEAGLNTAMVVGKIKLEHLYIPHPAGLFDATSTSDSQVKDRALQIIQNSTNLPQVLFIHLPDVDGIGHQIGWMSSAQLQAVSNADILISEMIAALERGGYLSKTLLIITADHGGHDTTHLVLPPWPEDMTIPWLAVGPGVAANVNLNRAINTYDTAATAAYALGLPLPETWDGQPIIGEVEKTP